MELKFSLDRERYSDVFEQYLVKMGFIDENGFTDKFYKSFENEVFLIRPFFWDDCFSDDTEILTKNGWKNVSLISYSDEVLSLNKKTNEGYYQKPVKLFKKQYDGKMYQVKGELVDILVSPEHKMYVKLFSKKITHDFSLIKASELNHREYRFKKNFNWNGKNKNFFTLKKIISKYYNRKQVKIKMDLWLEFFGWYISEGFVRFQKQKTKTTNYVISIAQSRTANKKKCILIKNLIEKIGWRYHYNQSRFNISSGYNKQLFEYLNMFGKAGDKFIPQEIKNLEKRQLKILLNSMMLGDGNSNCYYTTSKILADDVQEIMCKCGYTSDITRKKCQNKKWRDCYVVRLHEVRHYPKCNINKKNKALCSSKWIDYKGMIYGITMKSDHIIYTRRNGKPVWIGNCECDFAFDNKHGFKDHAFWCRCDQPNFIHKPTAFILSWYKHPIRGNSCNKDISYDEWKKILESCLKSLEPKPENKIPCEKCKSTEWFATDMICCNVCKPELFQL